MFTPDREINPPSFYEDSEPELENCPMCYNPFEKENLFRLEMGSKEFVCSKCLHDYHNQEP